jgi:quercetin dioxygenase-like cupin family protein
MLKHIGWIGAVALTSALIGSASAQDSANRKELKRADLTGTNMEIVVSISELKPGESIPRHIHHGEEALYVIDGGTIELPDGKQIPFVPGNAAINVRDIPHAGFKVAGDKTLKFITVHVVDKGKPLYDPR